MTSAYDIRRRTAEKMAQPVKGQQQATIDGVDPVQQLPKHIPATAKARLQAIRERCAERVEEREAKGSTA